MLFPRHESNLDPRGSTLTAGVPRVYARVVGINRRYVHWERGSLDLESNPEFSKQKNVCLNYVMRVFLNVSHYAILKIIGGISPYHESS